MVKTEGKSPMKLMMEHFPHSGEVQWIGIRPERRAALQTKSEVVVSKENGLLEDHYAGSPQGKRQITFIQAEHLEAIASYLDKKSVDPGLLRRNVVVRGINLLSLKGKVFKIGSAVFEMTGLCHPCSRMEENLGLGGYNAVRGHGGITAMVLEDGSFKVGEKLTIILK